MKIPSGAAYRETLRIARERGLHTICEDAKCPNIAECWGRKTATFMILGDVCTRGCGFCSVGSGSPRGIDPDEPRRTADAVKALGIRHAVITSVTRDDLPDGGAFMFAETVREIRRSSPGSRVELLIPDFRGDVASLQKVWDARPDVLGHNIECVPRLQKMIRPAAGYETSIFVLTETKNRAPGIPTKTGIQVGHGETREEILDVMDDLVRIRLDILTIGQYLQPARAKLPVRRFYTPEEFQILEREARTRGIPHVQSGPLVRSSYRAEGPFERRTI